MGYKAGNKAFYMCIRRHLQQGHRADAILLTKDVKIKPSLTKATIEEFGQRMLELGMVKLDQIDPDNPASMLGVKLSDVVAAQKLSLEAKKLKLTEDAMTAMMGKLFAPPNLNKEMVTEGEVVDDQP